MFATVLPNDSHSPFSTSKGSDVWDGGKSMGWYSSGGWDPSKEDDPLAWVPRVEAFEDPYVIARKERELPDEMVQASPAQFVHAAFRMPREDGLGYEPFSFVGRRHLLQPYDCGTRKLLLVCSRQTEKSTMLGNVALAYSCMAPAHSTLYVSPSALQTKTFSNDRLKEPLETSSILKRFTTTRLSQNVFEKQFVNRAIIRLRYAFLNADRCAVGGTRVHFVDGSVATLQDIHENPKPYMGEYVWSVNPDKHVIQPTRLLEVVPQGLREVCTVRLAGGTELTCTHNQPLLTWDGWKMVQDLSEGDFVAAPRSAPHGQGNDIPLEEYRLVGYLLGDGKVVQFKDVALYNSNREVLDDFHRCALALGAVVGRELDSSPRQWVNAHTKKRQMYGGRNGYKQRLRELGLIGSKHDTKRVPFEFFSGDAHQVSDFLRAIYATDGWACTSGDRYEIGYCSNSKGLLQDLKVLLSRFGILAFVSKRKKPSTDAALGAYILSIRNAPSVRSFCASIGIVGKEEAVDEVHEVAWAVGRCKDDHDRIPLSYASLRDYLKFRYGLSTHAAWVQHRIQLRPGNTKDSVGRRVLGTIAEKLKDPYLESLAACAVGWVRIESMEDAGEQEAFDLTVEEHENYLVDGLFIHNTRGIRADKLMVDELQDILSDNIPVMEHCLSHANPRWKGEIFAGTPKSLDNTIEYYRSQKSTQGEWVVPCDKCGSKAKGAKGRHWNILGESNIQKKGLSCANCGKPIDAAHDDAQWAFMCAWDEHNTPWESYRINQLMVPWKKWSDIWYEYRNNSREKFFNEALGLSYDSGLRPMTLAQIKAACNPKVSMSNRHLDKWRSLGYSQPVFMGLDYGTGENSYTVISLGTYKDMKMQVFYVERCVGELLDVDKQVEHIKELANRFNVRVIGADYGGGYDRNDRLMRWCGPQRLVKFQYMARSRRKVEWDKGLLRFKCHRTEVMSDIFNALKRGVIMLPRWEEFHADGKEPYATDILNIFSEYSETLRQIQYHHSVDKPDDTLHSIVYLMLGSMLIRPRPDIIVPRREEKGQPGRQYGYSGPVDQG